MPEKLTNDQYAVMIIANAGDSKSSSMEAIAAARQGDFPKARELLLQSTQSLSRAHDIHTELLVDKARRKSESISMILSHASNHYSIAEVTRMMAEEIVNIYSELNHKQVEK